VSGHFIVRRWDGKVPVSSHPHLETSGLRNDRLKIIGLLREGIMRMRRCGRCGVRKPYGEYYRHKDGYDGRESTCKECRSARNRENRKQRMATSTEV
jgi:hypothetical protein